MGGCADSRLNFQKLLILKLKIMFKKNPNASNLLYTMLVAVLLWVAISSSIQRFKCPKMTEIELFMNIPKYFTCDWVYCY